MSLDNATNPVVEETAVSTAPEVETNDAPQNEATETDEPEFDENGEPISAPAPVEETEEVDFEGQKVKVPKLIKDALLRHADYTRKTQELAEQRKSFEASRNTSLAQDREFVDALASVRSHDAHLEQYKNVDWTTLEQTDPAAAQQHWRIFSQLKEGRTQAERTAMNAQQRLAMESQRARATRLQEVQAKLPTIIPDWTPDLDVKLANFGTAEGLTRDELADATLRNPAFVRILNLARQQVEATKKQATEKRIASSQSVKPAVEIGSKAPAGKDPVRMGTDEWMRWRSQQLSKRK